MTDGSEVKDFRTETSPWPLFVALGIALSEVGVLLGIRPVTVGGLLLFVGTVAGLVRDSGYPVRSEMAVGSQGVILVIIGLVLITVNRTGSTVRGQSIVIAGAISLVAVVIWLAYTRR